MPNYEVDLTLRTTLPSEQMGEAFKKALDKVTELSEAGWEITDIFTRKIDERESDNN